jgi:RHS repeat-associated protein
MKKILYLLNLVPFLVIGQTQSENYSKVTTYKVPTSTSISNPSQNEASIEVTYYDGLGRPIQKVANKQSNSGKDIITHIEYDAFGRQSKEYLPYASTSSNLTFDANGLQNTLNFSDVLSPAMTPINYIGDKPYSEKLYENSPLNRVLKQAAIGNTWGLGNSHEIQFDYQTNDTLEVVKFRADAVWDSSLGLYDLTLVTDDYYLPNQLYKTITKNENWVSGSDNTTEEFKDKEGRVVLKRTYNDQEAYDTYYVYDIYGNLTYVIPPKVEISNATNTEILDNLCYQYKYDYRNRLVEKKLPGKQWEYIVYDNLDRVVATGPANSPFSEQQTGWLITKYDVFNRVAYTAWLGNDSFSSEKRFQYQKDFNHNNETLSETKSGSNVDNVNNLYSSNVTPLNGYKVLTINYYDDYNFSNGPQNIPNAILDQPVLHNTKGMATGSWVRVLTTPSETLAEVNYNLYDSKSRVIETKTTNILGGFTIVDTKYNFIGQVLQSITLHKKADAVGLIKITEDFQYTPQGRLLNHTHQINDDPKELIAHNLYDELGKLISKNVGGGNVSGFSGLQKVDYGYNIRGWLTNINNVENLNNNGSPTDLFAFKINYDQVDNDVNHQINKLYNGNISETYWKTSSDNVKRKYGYQYDNLNRLLNSIYQKPDTPSNVTNSYNESMKYDKNGNIISLMRNGELDDQVIELSIDDLTYNYQHNSNKLNKVTDATNDPNGFKDDTDLDPNDTNDDYTYDLNGNMIQDTNKGIESISYNHLNLPTQLTFANSSKINYFYNALGKKVRKQVIDLTSESSVVTTTDYLDGFQYKNGNLQFFPTAEGYVNCNAPTITQSTLPDGTVIQYMQDESIPTFSYVYNYLDHLGNIRLSYSKDPQNGVLRIIEENHYYPFGLKHANYNSGKNIYTKEMEILKIKPLPPLLRTSYNYKYNGKELQDELGLNMYTYGFRDYDPAIARWVCVDPLAEKSRRWSPYNYCVDNPVRFIDPDGREIINITGGVRFTGDDAKIAFMAIRDEIRETGGVKTHFVEEAKTPNIYRHTLNSFRKGKPDFLHYDSDKDRQNQRRRESTGAYPTMPGFQRDEYPYASTFEGGKGADVAYVPSKENSSQGGSLGALYKTMKQGEGFLVLPVPKDKEPDAVPDPVPVSIPLPSAESVNRAVKPAVTTATILTIITMIVLSPIGI